MGNRVRYGPAILGDLQQQAAERTLGEEFDARIYAAQPRGISVVLRNVDDLRLARATREKFDIDHKSWDAQRTLP
jgi:hypothetical protein